ncbi:MAG: GatB/YqeY domain-containing protein [Armatimonadota bacterium]|nr:GatB/YqeY domain-containing protein [Armatimonadota bacterium]MDR7443493.1 GatB/YqeY domain-containing protein [Armatimonadota bacterium]MDR7569332.1 GatB/YqeY domain-containing protein [Armatimonadota bacterium]MDR7614992.1 GatB/YqeY domain-containing protein [Armatimonadota bacterium]
MTLLERLGEDLKQALKARDTIRVSTLRLARAALHNAEIQRGRPLTDEEAQEVLRLEARRRKEAIEAFRRAGREEMAHREELELAVLLEYLPAPLSREELRRIVQEAIQKLGARTERDAGRVIGAVMREVRGRAEGRDVERLVREALGSGP